MVKDILLLGNPELYEISLPVAEEELDQLHGVIRDLHDTLMDFRSRYGAGRAIAAPQIGVRKRMIYMFIEEPRVLINPELGERSDEMMTVWDDCMSFPDLFVKVVRHRECRIAYMDMDWKTQEMVLKGDLSELLQHEYDHLDGILAVSRAADARSFALRSQKRFIGK